MRDIDAGVTLVVVKGGKISHWPVTQQSFGRKQKNRWHTFVRLNVTNAREVNVCDLAYAKFLLSVPCHLLHVMAILFLLSGSPVSVLGLKTNGFKANDSLEVGVARGEYEAVLFAKGSNPDIVVLNGAADTA